MNEDPIIYFHLSFPGGGGLFPVLIGKALAMQKCLREKLPIGAKFLYSGISSGSFVALLFALEFSEAEMDQLVSSCLIDPIQTKWYVIEQFHMWYLLKHNVRKIVGNDGHKLLNGIYRVGVAKLNLTKGKWETWVIDQFESAEDVSNAIMTSSHMALLGRQPFRLFRQKIAFDGGLTCDHIETCHLPKEVQARTVTFRVGYDYIPRQLLQFHQAMPLFTFKKWTAMKEQGRLAFQLHTERNLIQWLTKEIVWSAQEKKEKNKPCKLLTVRTFYVRGQPAALEAEQKKQAKMQERKGGGTRGLATGWLDMVSGYLVWGAMFSWRFLLNNPL